MKDRAACPPPTVLLTFTGFHDPFAASDVSGTEQEGPVLSLVRAHPVNRVVLLSTPNTAELTKATETAIRERHADVSVEVRHLPLQDPTDYFQVLGALRADFAEISKQLGKAAYFVATASGTPQMHACWVLLVASGEIPARILHVRPPRFVTADKPAVTEVDLSRREFPTIRPRTLAHITSVEETNQPTSLIIQRLGIIGDHPAFVRALETATALARSESPVVISGESGTGKEKIALLIHHLSSRAGGEFVAINCAAIPAALAESTLFGHKKGAFTGATTDHQGKFDVADGGTLFLDEVVELPMDVQAKLLRALQEGIIEPVGSAKGRKVRVRIIAATNRDLRAAIREGKFREDLYYRLAVGEVHVPSLRERRSDIVKLALLFLDNANLPLRRPRRFASETLSQMQIHDWPGNVRELENCVQRAVLLAKEEEIRPEHIDLRGASQTGATRGLPEPHEGFSVEVFLAEARRGIYGRALEMAGGNRSRAARLLGISPQAVSKFLKGEGQTAVNSG